ncbi:hypothetical protein CALVIDRAFT_533632 [Calocera viscosa TUFC12733]|uniref:Uncharacterized protein n=1 Tax=Calocera viscosa (strain TUFC12733) TaxID=1330018 RepID=A0A167R710_CALVF|nr:hypothetical protein CALVIDRAFT_533632 [Calocera viscosa TUFC12733]
MEILLLNTKTPFAWLSVSLLLCLLSPGNLQSFWYLRGRSRCCGLRVAILVPAPRWVVNVPVFGRGPGKQTLDAWAAESDGP